MGDHICCHWCTPRKDYKRSSSILYGITQPFYSPKFDNQRYPFTLLHNFLVCVSLINIWSVEISPLYWAVNSFNENCSRNLGYVSWKLLIWFRHPNFVINPYRIIHNQFKRKHVWNAYFVLQISTDFCTMSALGHVSVVIIIADWKR